MIKIKEYGIYDLKEDEQCIYIGTMSEVSKFLNYNKDTLWSYLSRKKHDRSLLISHRYEIVEVIEEEEIEQIDELRIAGITTEEMENRIKLKEVLNDTLYDSKEKINELVRAVNKLNKEREEK